MSTTEPTSFNHFVFLHEPQLVSSGVPKHLWKSLHHKIEKEILDAGSVFSLLMIDYGDEEKDETSPMWTVYCSNEKGVIMSDPNSIFLIDHAWTFEVAKTRQHLEQNPQLAVRLARIMGINPEVANRNERIFKCMWKYAHFYSIHDSLFSVESRIPIWYVMDELGSGINHCDDPNVKLVPFYCITNRTTYSLLFPIKDCAYGEQIFCDFIENIPKDSIERSAQLLPWGCEEDFKEYSFNQTEPRESYFKSGRLAETLPCESVKEPEIDRNRPLKVYSEYDVIKKYLTSTQFEIVDDENEADVLWLVSHYKCYEDLSKNSPNKFINQFPFENVITVKDLLGIVCRRGIANLHNPFTLETYPKWLPTTYNLRTELIKFVSYYQNRKEKKLDNHWIIKPFNLARGLDTFITNNLFQIMRVSTSGPKIAQKYIEDPVLLFRKDINCKVKFDIRYVILLRSLEPLKAYIYTKFFLRMANKSFSMDRFEDYEKHFTVMNYNESAELCRIEYDDFIKLWEEQYPDYAWTAVEDSVLQMFKEVLLKAKDRKPPCGIAPSPQSRALYAADLMLAWHNKHVQPKLLEINWMPDCKRACEYYPNFFNDVFNALFLDQLNEDFRVID